MERYDLLGFLPACALAEDQPVLDAGAIQVRFSCKPIQNANPRAHVWLISQGEIVSTNPRPKP
jgi:hypothetical protein